MRKREQGPTNHILHFPYFLKGLRLPTQFCKLRDWIEVEDSLSRSKNKVLVQRKASLSLMESSLGKI